MHIVTFCSHQPYLYLFKDLHVQFDVIQIAQHKRFLQNWNEKVRPLPANMKLVTFEQAKANLQAGTYQVALAHNINDYIDFIPYNLKKILLFHTTLSGRLVEDKSQIDIGDYKANILQLITRTNGKMVFGTDLKKRDWGFDGRVILPTVDVEEPSQFTGEQACILRVSNQLLERGEILNYDMHKKVTTGFATKVIGYNPKLENTSISNGWNELKLAYQTNRVYLHTASPELEDGFNMAVLEAMAQGMPIITNEHPSSPVINGINGFASDDVAHLRDQIQELFSKRDMAVQMGEASRQIVLEKFSKSAFIDAWMDEFQST